MLRRAGFITVIAALMVAGTLPMAFAASSRFQHAKVRRFKACVGIIPTMGEPTPAAGAPNPFPAASAADPDARDRQRSPNPNPYIFYVMDQRKDLRPDGWEFYNPAAEPYPAAALAARWGITTTTPLKPDMGAYWEVNISEANFNRLAEMDLIYIPISRRMGMVPAALEAGTPTFFTEEQRRVLARLADSGVTIWVDWAIEGPTIDNALGGGETNTPVGRRKNAFFTNVDFAAGTGQALTPSIRHPLLDDPYLIMSDATDLGRGYPMVTGDTNRIVETRALDMQPTMNLAAVVPTSARPPDQGAFVAAGRYGAGYVIATAGNVGGAIAGFIPENTVRVTSQDLGAAEAEDLKFAYNAFAWSSEVTNTQENSRHTGQSSMAIDGMIEQGNYPHLVPGGGGLFVTYPSGLPLAGLPVNPVAPLIVNGLAIAAVRTPGQSELSVFELNPNDDFDGNGFIDDPNNAGTPANSGLIDYSVGQNYDRVEGLDLGTATLYGLTLGELPDLAAPQGAAAFIFGGGSGGLVSVPAPRRGVPPNWAANRQTLTPAQIGMQVTGAPAFALLPGQTTRPEPKLYAGGLQAPAAFGQGGRVMGLAVLPNGAMAPEWYYPPSSEANRMGIIAGSLVTAQVLDTGTGQVDTMVFSTTVAPDTTIAAGAGQQGEAAGRVEGFVVATRGEPLTFPVGNQAAMGSNPTAGRRFVGARLVNNAPGQGQAANQRDLLWDPSKYYEVRVMDKGRNYVLARFVPGTPGFSLLTDGTAGQVELPEPSAANGLAAFSMDPSGTNPRLRNQWNLNDFVLLADYSVLPAPVDNGLQGQATIRPRFAPATPYVRTTAQTVDPTGVAGGVAVGKDNLVYYATGKGYMCAVEWRRGRPAFRWKFLGVQTWGDQRTGHNTSAQVDPALGAGYLPEYAFVSSPAAGDRIVFTSRGGTAYVFEPDATLRCKLVVPGVTIPWSAGLANEVVIEGDHGLGILPNNPGIMATQQPWGRAPNQFTVDPDTGTLTFLNMENIALDLSQALSPAECLMAGIDTGGRPGVRIRWWFRNLPPGSPAGLPTRTMQATAIVPLPLVAVYHPTTPVANDSFLSGAVLTRDKIFMMGQSGWLHELPLDPKSVDPSFPRPGPGLNGFNLADPMLYGNGLRRVKNVAVGPGMPPSMASPAITDGMVLTNTPRGLTIYSSPNVLIADSNRVVEASGNSTALAATDTVMKHRMDISEFAIPTDPGFANTVVNMVSRPILTDRKMLSRPSVVRKLDRHSSLTGLFTSTTITDAPIDDDIAGIKQNPDYADSSYLVADTGNNRVVEFNAAGKVVWEATDIFDPMDFVSAGEPLKLSGPMDAQRWVEREAVPGFPEPLYVIHTLIADTGNNRVVEIVDKVQYSGGNYGPNSFVVVPGQVGSNGQPFRWYHVVVWASQTNAQGLRLRYRTAQRIYWPDANGNRIPLPGAPAPANPGGALPVPPYLPKERALTYVMASVTGQQVYYPGNPATPGSGSLGYFQFYGSPSRQVVERRPEVRSGSDSIVFLRGNWKVDESAGNSVQFVPAIREGYPMGFPVAPGEYRYAQGVIEPNLPILTHFKDELLNGNPQPAPNQPLGNPVHYLNGVSSVQLTVRSDIKFALETYGGGVMTRYPYLLVADTDGVWEGRLMPGTSTCFLSWAFTMEDYAYVTGAGNGNPLLVTSPVGANHTPGGRRFNPASARRLSSGLVLISSRIPTNEQPRGAGGQFTHLNIGSDVFMLRPTDYRTAGERPGIGFPSQYNRASVASHGWQPDLWVQNKFPLAIPSFLQGSPSIRWRAAEQLDPNRPPTLRTQFEGGTVPANPAELTGTYIPSQPIFADIAY